MKKLLLALMAVAAISLVSCDKNKPNDPNQGGNNTENKDPQPEQTKEADVTIAVGFADDWFKIVDIVLYDSVDNQAPKQEQFTELHTDMASILLATDVKLQDQPFDGCFTYRGFSISKHLTTKQSVGLRCELKLKENYMDILKAMEPGTVLRTLYFVAYGTQEHAPKYSVQTNSYDKVDVHGMLEKQPDRIVQWVEEANQFLSDTFAFNSYGEFHKRN